MNWDLARQAVRDEVHRQRPDLVLEQDIAAFLGINLVTVRGFFSGRVERPRGSTRAKIEDALGWERHLLEKIAQGRVDPPVAAELTERRRARAAMPSLTDDEFEVVWAALQAHRESRHPTESKDSPSEGSQRQTGDV